MNPVEAQWQRVDIEACEITKTGFLGFAGAFTLEGTPYLVVCQTREDLEGITRKIYGDEVEPAKFKEVLVLHVASRTTGGNA